MSTLEIAVVQRTGPRRRALAWLVVTQLVALVSLVPWFVVAGFWWMGLGGGSGPQPAGVWAAAAALWAYPLVPLVFGVLAWRAFRRQRYGRAMALTTIPLLFALALLAYVGWMATG